MKLLNRLPSLCNAIFFSTLFLNSFAFAQSSASAVDQLVSILAQSHTIRANVEQTTLDQGGIELEQTTAKLMLQKPDQFYWEIVEPYSELMLVNGEKIWRFEPDLEQVIIQNFEDDLSRSPILFLNGDADLIADSYSVSVSEFSSEGLTRFVLLPLKAGSIVERLSLTFVDNRLEEMQFENSLGQKTNLFFSQFEMNVPLDQSVFEFTPPAGVEIIDTTQF